MKAVLAEKQMTVSGMTCAHCKEKVERALLSLPGVKRAAASFASGSVRVVYDPSKSGEAQLARAIENAGYRVGKKPAASGKERLVHAARFAAVIAGSALFYLFLRRTGVGAMAGALPLAEEGMGYGMLFLIGLITSVHCVVMCGGINLSQCMGAGSAAAGGDRIAPDGRVAGGGRAALTPSLLYNLGRVVSYSAFGAVVGAIGSAISFSTTVQGVIQAVAGAFMVIMGLTMTGMFPWLARFVPRMPRFFTRGLGGRGKRSAGPFYVGLINGLMPCGPLQAMQLYALSTGSPGKGALSMLLFSLGTVPLMFGLGALSALMSRRFTQRAMAVGAVLVVALGLSMFSGALSLAGIAIAPAGGASAAALQSASGAGVQKVRTTLEPGRYTPITVTAGSPVEWTIDAPKGAINGCNDRMYIPSYGIEHRFSYGENVIRFTPDKPGLYAYSCWMGMIVSTIQVIEPGEVATGTAADLIEEGEEIPEWLQSAQGGCCGEGAGQIAQSLPEAAADSCCGLSGAADAPAFGWLDGDDLPGAADDPAFDWLAGDALPGGCCG